MILSIRFLVIVAILFHSGIPETLAQSQGLEIGNIAPEISLPAPDGNFISLSSLRGKLVLIDFWATWCGPCINEQPLLARLYKKYGESEFTKAQDFEIYGVSLDTKKASWEKSIRKMKIDWIQVSDLKFWGSPIAETYDIQALPFNVLIDERGVIIAKNLHGKALEQSIEILIKK